MKQQIYAGIANDVINQIKTGQLKSGDKLPSERDLCKIYNASQSSVKKALKFLIDRDYLYSEERIGFFVNIPKSDSYVFRYDETRFIKTLITDEVTLEPILLPVIKFPEYIKTKNPNNDEMGSVIFPVLMLSSKTPVLYFERHFLFRETTLLENIRKKPSIIKNILFNMIDTMENKKIHIRIILANEYFSEIFQMKTQSPLFLAETVGYDFYGKIGFYTKAYYRLNDFQLHLKSE